MRASIAANDYVMGWVAQVCPNKRNIAAILVLAYYLLALTLAGWFHEHGSLDRSPGYAACAGRLCPEPLHCCPNRHGSHQGKTLASHDPTSHDSGSCLVCRFLGQKPAPPACSLEAISRPLNEGTEPVKPIRAARDVPSTRDIRGPPHVA